MFDVIVKQYPKHADQWNIYVDMETNYGDVEHTREVFKRATEINFSSKITKGILKKCILLSLLSLLAFFDLGRYGV